MTEEEAIENLSQRVSRETLRKLELLVQTVSQAAETQNLIANSTRTTIWVRHVLDSAQLMDLAPASCDWIDVGSGAGFPGLVAAILSPQPFTLIESRRLRADFLSRAVKELNLPNVVVHHGRAEKMRVAPRFAGIISARAVAPLATLFEATMHLANAATIWLLPKGRSASTELAQAMETWQGDFVMHPSLTDPDAAIVVARNVRRKSGLPQ